MKYITILIFIILFYWSYGQASSSGDFFIQVEFEKDIPVEKVEVNYYQVANNRIDNIIFKTNSLKNSIEISGHHSFVIGAGLPLIVFSYKEKIRNDLDSLKNQENEKIEVQNLYYLVIHKDSFKTSNKNFNSTLKFSNAKPNIIIRYKNINGNIEYIVSNESDHFLPINEMPISNKLIKVEKLIK